MSKNPSSASANNISQKIPLYSLALFLQKPQKSALWSEAHLPVKFQPFIPQLEGVKITSEKWFRETLLRAMVQHNQTSRGRMYEWAKSWGLYLSSSCWKFLSSNIENVRYRDIYVYLCVFVSPYFHGLPWRVYFWYTFRSRSITVGFFHFSPSVFLIMDLGYCLPNFTAWSFTLGPGGNPAAPFEAVPCSAGLGTAMEAEVAPKGWTCGGRCHAAGYRRPAFKRLSTSLSLLETLIVPNLCCRQKSNNFWRL